jgi:ribosomal protein S27AE
MASTVSLLGVIAILLTAAGSYRFSRSFFNQGLFPVLIAAAATLSFVVLFPYIILLTGFAVFFLPIAFLIKKTNTQLSLSQQSSGVGAKGKAIITGALNTMKNKAAPEDKSSGNQISGSLDPYNDEKSNKKDVMCPQCGETIEAENPNVCGYCGSNLGD